MHKKFIKRAQVSVLQRRNKGYAAWYCKASNSTCTIVRKDTCHLPPAARFHVCDLLHPANVLLEFSLLNLALGGEFRSLGMR